MNIHFAIAVMSALYQVNPGEHVEPPEAPAPWWEPWVYWPAYMLLEWVPSLALCAVAIVGMLVLFKVLSHGLIP